MDIENNQNLNNANSPDGDTVVQNLFPTILPSSQISIPSPPIKHYTSVPPNKFQQ